MAGQNTAHTQDWSGPTSRANRMDRKHNRSTTNKISPDQITALMRGDTAGFLRVQSLKAWADKHRAG